jgi:hypothetical protein
MCVPGKSLLNTLTVPQAKELVRLLISKNIITNYQVQDVDSMNKDKLCKLLDMHGAAKLMSYTKAKAALAEVSPKKSKNSESSSNASGVEVPKSKVDCSIEIKNKRDCFIGKKIGTLTIKEAQQILVCEHDMDFNSIKKMNKEALCTKLKELGAISEIGK